MRIGVTNHNCVASTSSRGLLGATPVSRPVGVKLCAVPSRVRLLASRATPEGGNAPAHTSPELLTQDDTAPRGPRVAWNKGVPFSDAAKMKISEGMKNKWRDPEFKAAVSASLKGKPAWNKGRTLSEETREKMRLAKLNHSVDRDTRQKMSAARRGKPLSPEAAALVSAKLAGKPKSEEHKAAIAATQRRRHAAIRVLRAVESVYEASQEESRRGSVSRALLGGAGGGVSASGKSQSKTATSKILNAFKAELREYRSLQEELSPWTKAFQERHGRKPTMVDVQRTGIEWLVTRYKQYVLLRERLFNETSVLRSRLGDTGSSLQETVGEGTALPSGMPQGLGPINANGLTRQARSAMASRVAVAMEYKRKKGSASLSSDSDTESLVPPPKSPIFSHAHAPTTEDKQQGSAAPTPDAADLARIVAARTEGNVPSRVRAAMHAALEYRKRKAHATKAKAEAAAVSAKAGWNDVQLSKRMVVDKLLPKKGEAGLPKEIANAEGNAPLGGGIIGDSSGYESKPISLPGLPEDVVRAQAAAHQALADAKQAEAEVWRALRRAEVTSSGEYDSDTDAMYKEGNFPDGSVVTVAGAGA